MFRMLWLRRLIRNTTSPIPINKAELWQKRFKLLYSILAWNALGLVGIACYKGKLDWAEYHGITEKETGTSHESPGEKWLKFFKPNNASVYRISGIKTTKIAEYSDGKRIDTHVAEEK